jgi:hypothetical protein
LNSGWDEESDVRLIDLSAARMAEWRDDRGVGKEILLFEADEADSKEGAVRKVEVDAGVDVAESNEGEEETLGRERGVGPGVVSVMGNPSSFTKLTTLAKSELLWNFN